MAHNEQSHEQIDRYLDGELSGNEKQAFEAELSNNQALRKEVKLHRLVEEVIADKQEAALEATLRSMRPAASDPVVRKLWPQLAAAASAVVLVTAFFLFRGSSGQEYTGPQTYLSDEPMELTSMGGATGSLSDGQEAYNAGNFDLAAEELSLFLVSNTDRQDVRLYAARAAIASEDYPQALTLLEYFEGRDHLAKEEVSWLNALALLGLERNQEALPMLEALESAADEEIREKATQLIDVLADMEVE